jgi:hypothetical protein
MAERYWALGERPLTQIDSKKLDGRPYYCRKWLNAVLVLLREDSTHTRGDGRQICGWFAGLNALSGDPIDELTGFTNRCNFQPLPVFTLVSNIVQERALRNSLRTKSLQRCPPSGRILIVDDDERQRTASLVRELVLDLGRDSDIVHHFIFYPGPLPSLGRMPTRGGRSVRFVTCGLPGSTDLHAVVC